MQAYKNSSSQKSNTWSSQKSVNDKPKKVKINILVPKKSPAYPYKKIPYNTNLIHESGLCARQS